MGTRLLFDLETDGLKPTVVWCIVYHDLDTGEVRKRYGDESIQLGLADLAEAEELWGHNIVDYDLPVLRKLYGFETDARIYDTLRASRQAYPGKELGKRDFILIRRGIMPAAAVKKPHSLEAWGYRLGCPKVEHSDFSSFSQSMLDYCANDVALNVKLAERLLTRTPKVVIEIESKVQQILQAQHETGVAFNAPEAAALAARLAARREELTEELRATFPPWYAPNGKATLPKVSRPKAGVAAGCEYQNVQRVEFNPASGQHIARVLKKKYGWEPNDWTDSGLAKTEEKILADLPWPECQKIVEYQRLKKILGYISEGDGAWLRLEKDGRIHGRVHATGTVTNRGSHVEPNLGQVPKVGKPFGRECRALFTASPGMVLVGADASGLQLRMLAHYLAPYDNRAFALVIENGQDVHLYMQERTCLIRRDNKKTSNYAWLFGAGNYKQGTIAIFDKQNAKELGEWSGPVPSLKNAARIGAQVRRDLEDKLQMKGLNANLKRAAQRGYLTSLDGRSIPVLSQHKALNTLLMGGEAVVMKHAMIRADELTRGLSKQVLWVHDEFQHECRPEHAEEVGRRLVQAIVETGQKFNLRVRLDAEFKVGQNWSETH